MAGCAFASLTLVAVIIVLAVKQSHCSAELLVPAVPYRAWAAFVADCSRSFGESFAIGPASGSYRGDDALGRI